MVRKRKTLRFRCHGAAELSDGGNRKLWGRLGDICAAGFYVSTVGPWPINTEVEFRLQVDNTVVRGKGVVASTNPGVGMTVIIREITQEHAIAFEKLMEGMTESANSPITANWRV
ncbi:PilZ domain-containing protein [Candidatus Korobacter versatilis]|nr:PilZ domain-containing protein [Candidatus Koribacter versatilis]